MLSCLQWRLYRLQAVGRDGLGPERATVENTEGEANCKEQHPDHKTALQLLAIHKKVNHDAASLTPDLVT